MGKFTNIEKVDIYQKVTDQIVSAIEAGSVGNWRMPWHTSGKFAFSPRNVDSKKAYRGINTLCLWGAAQAKGYESGEWGTYKQWTEKGAQVRKGEKSTTVVFWKFVRSGGSGENGESGDADGGENSSSSSSRLAFTRGYPVFNAGQVDNYTPKVEKVASDLERIESAERFFKTVGADLRHGGNRAYYQPGGDYIQMPPFEAFKDELYYYSTLAHEHTHWTGKAGRCERSLKGRFGDMDYAAEELIAELGAAFVLARLGLCSQPREDHAQYVANWLKVLKGDKWAIFTASSKAQAACDWMVERGGLEDGEEEPEEVSTTTEAVAA